MPQPAPPPEFDPRRYWRGTLRRTLVLLAVWLIAGPLMGIVFVEPLNRYTLGGIPFGFWMAQQGSIYTFVVLIFVYAWLSDRADRREGIRETDVPPPAGGHH